MVEVGGVALYVAFGAGLLSAASPCVLPLVPVYIGYLTGASASPSTVVADSRPATSPFGHSLAFVTGFSAVFVVLGTSVGVIGFLLRDNQDIMLKVAGGLLIFLGLHLSGVITIPWLEQERRLQHNSGQGAGYLRSFLVGSTFSAGWTPCVGPTLGAILALAATSATVWQGSLLLVLYSAGLSIPFLAMGFALTPTRRLYTRIRPVLGAVNFVSGTLLIIVGILIFTDSLTNLNQLSQFEGFDFGGDV
jgi:cytochrome c-type biogenesis protein